MIVVKIRNEELLISSTFAWWVHENIHCHFDNLDDVFDKFDTIIDSINEILLEQRVVLLRFYVS